LKYFKSAGGQTINKPPKTPSFTSTEHGNVETGGKLFNLFIRLSV
jgi:hypothetical protein